MTYTTRGVFPIARRHVWRGILWSRAVYRGIQRIIKKGLYNIYIYVYGTLTRHGGGVWYTAVDGDDEIAGPAGPQYANELFTTAAGLLPTRATFVNTYYKL